jgi:hypothetical protein
MKNITLFLPSLLIMLLSGCLGLEDDATTTAASQTAVVAKAPSSVVSSGLVGKTITFNPTITFVADNNLSYFNDKVGDYPVVQGTVYGKIEIDPSDSDTDKLSLKININGDVIVLSFGFRDLGGEGYIDEAVLDEVKVNDEVKVLPAKVTVAIDAGTIRNENVKIEDLPDFSGAPTSEEWNKYIVGTAMLITSDANTTWSGNVESTLVYFTSSGAGVYYDMDDGETGNFSYNYTPPSSEGSNIGEVSVVSEWIQNDPDYPDSLGNAMRDKFSMKLTFTEFYNGKREDNPGGGIC